MKMSTDPNWLRKMAEKEDGQYVGVGSDEGISAAPPPDFDAKAREVSYAAGKGLSRFPSWIAFEDLMAKALRDAHDSAVKQCIAHAVHVRDVVYGKSPEHAIGAETVVRVIEREMGGKR